MKQMCCPERQMRPYELPGHLFLFQNFEGLLILEKIVKN